MAVFRTVVVSCIVWLSLAALCLGQVAPFAPASSTAPPFVGRYYSHATTFYGRTILYGGVSDNGFLNDVWVSSDDGASWTFTPSTGLPLRASGALVTIQTDVNNTELLLFIGGTGNGGDFNDVYISEDGITFTNTGDAAFSARSAFAYTIALPVQGQSGNPSLDGLPALFVLGGANGPTPLNDVYYSSGSGESGFVVATAQAPWAARAYHSAVAVESGTRIVITAGQSAENTFFNDVWISDVGGVNWIQLTNAAPYRQRASFGFVDIAEKLFVFGGGANTQYDNDIWSSLDYGTSWTRGTVNAAFTPRSSFSLAVNGKEVVIIDGFSASGIVSGAGGVLNGALN